MVDRVWLDVPYSQKDQAKAAGARWDSNARRWYAPRAGVRELEAWAPLPPVPMLLPGENRAFGSGLFVDLVPSSCWFTNVRSCVDERDWDRLRAMVYGRAELRCEACGATKDAAQGQYLEAHERWEYDDARRVQTLRRLVCLCTACHAATHYGLATVKGTDGLARAHLQKVSGMSTRELRHHIDEAFAVWTRRSKTDWSLDLSILTSAGIRLRTPPNAGDRRDVAEASLDHARRLDSEA